MLSGVQCANRLHICATSSMACATASSCTHTIILVAALQLLAWLLSTFSQQQSHMRLVASPAVVTHACFVLLLLQAGWWCW